MTITINPQTEATPQVKLEEGVISVDPERHSGMPCFAGTRVPVQDLFDYLAEGESLSSFVTSFPTVTHEQARRVLHLAETRLLEGLTDR